MSIKVFSSKSSAFIFSATKKYDRRWQTVRPIPMKKGNQRLPSEIGIEADHENTSNWHRKQRGSLFYSHFFSGSDFISICRCTFLISPIQLRILMFICPIKFNALKFNWKTENGTKYELMWDGEMPSILIFSLITDEVNSLSSPISRSQHSISTIQRGKLSISKSMLVFESKVYSYISIFNAPKTDIRFTLCIGGMAQSQI